MANEERSRRGKRQCCTCDESSILYLHPVHEPIERFEQKSLADILKDIANIDLKSGRAGDVAQSLCGKCSRQLKGAYTFVLQARRVNDRLLASADVDRDDCESDTPQFADSKHLDCLNVESKAEYDEEHIFHTFNGINEPLKVPRAAAKDSEEIDPIAMHVAKRIKMDPEIFLSNSDEPNPEECGFNTAHEIQQPYVTMEPNCQATDEPNVFTLNDDKTKRQSVDINENASNTNLRLQIDLLKYQYDVIAGKLAEINVNLHQVLNNSKINKAFIQMFPLNSPHDLNEFEKIIPSLSEHDLIVTIQHLVSGGLGKDLHNLLGADIIKDFNYDGKQNKRPFKLYTRINDLIFKAVLANVHSKDKYIQEIKKGFRIEKNKMYKALCIQKKKKNLC